MTPGEYFRLMIDEAAKRTEERGTEPVRWFDFSDLDYSDADDLWPKGEAGPWPEL